MLHVDAHPDLYHDYEGNPRSHASPFARILEQSRRFGVEVVEWANFAPNRVPIPEAPLYVTIDLDGIDPAFAPAVSHPKPGGLTVRDVVAVLGRIRSRVVGADIVELNPSQAAGDATAIVAVKLIKELAGAMARA